MCGIAGFITQTSSADARPILERMTGAIRHRGPDEEGVYGDGLAWLGHRRLSIIDLSTGQQPMSNEDGSLWIIYNGEIFNHSGLRPELEAAGHRYVSHSDTEAILHAYEQFGPACLGKFRGMFAFVLWDTRRKKLFAARDRLGIKPLYYFWNGKLFAFASEIKALFEHPEICPVPDEAGLAEYLEFGYLSGESTLFRGIRKLMPGHYLELDCSVPRPEPKITRYWDVPVPSGPESSEPDSYWISETRRRLEETVRMRLMSDVPLGLFLSGGLDSSAVAALVKRMAPGPVKTFSVGYREEAYSELNYAATVAAAIGTEHYEVRMGRDDFFGALARLIWHEDEPITWPSSVSLYFVSRLAAQQVKVVLTGEGSDELFGGYERYSLNLLNLRAARLYRLAPAFLRRMVRRQVETSPLLGASLRRKIGHTVLGRDCGMESLYLDNFYGAFGSAEQQALRPAAAGAVYGNYLRYWNAWPDASPLRRMLYADQKTYLVELLMKQDQMSMACSIESRVPFLDHEFVEFAMAMPDRMKIRGGEQKYVLKKAVADLLPESIVYRKKMGFPTPLRAWLRDAECAPLLESLGKSGGFLSGYLNLASVREMVALHQAGRHDATDRIWRLLNLELWGQAFFNGARQHGAV
jgi:asparagine synthase (glutamine-hydrolysing)